ncbi:MAG: hypothetical protein Q4G05_04625 [Clostridia bacterium]|nr:hypothetical protein [Clostridia bacterium]
MNEDMSNLIDKLSNSLGNSEIPDNLKEVINNFASQNISKDGQNNNSNLDSISSIINTFNSKKETSDGTSSNIDIETILKIKNILDNVNSTDNNNSANLLRCLKPYLKENKQSKVDQYIKLLNMSKYLDIFNALGGEKKNDI